MRTVVLAVVEWSQYLVIGYFLVLNSTYLLLIGLAAQAIPYHARRRDVAGTEDSAVSPFTRPVSIVAAAYNEEATIVDSVRAMLGLRYPVHEVVVVDDGSRDGTFDRLREAFGLVQATRVQPGEIPVRNAPTSVHVSTRGESLVVVRKKNSGRADSLNVGIDLARYPLICMVDADSLLDSDALLVICQPFADDPLRVVAAGGVIRPVNDSIVRHGRVLEPRIPKKWLPRIQVVEYLRAFLMGRTGWARMGGLLIISGAFGLFRRDILVETGGLNPDSIGEDFELVVRIHRLMRDTRRPYRVVFIPEPVCWTEVPDTRKVLARQRRRWHRGLYETLRQHRGMLRPRYGIIGTVAMPYFIMFELIAPLVETIGLIIVIAGFACGVISPDFAILFMLAAFGYAIAISLLALLLDELGLHRYKNLSDLVSVTAAAVAENLGYRQLTALWRLQGWWAALRGGVPVWGEMTRSGFAATTQAAISPLTSGTHAAVPEPQTSDSTAT
ncbi:glycosyltransferase family 2 protein [Streptomyces lunaelactis]|uniref:glycosyltransferase family 2 protein n=1 Tax=Streptomyces lunaelactis TaxID=1535768 RepID=UPI0015845B93|nr:glycosyltransferase [Streptomyces lunaelactis]NUK58896.1 glycosyltransferase family 2 protein [Streptomyces lunaelactis]